MCCKGGFVLRNCAFVVLRRKKFIAFFFQLVSFLLLWAKLFFWLLWRLILNWSLCLGLGRLLSLLLCVLEYGTHADEGEECLLQLLVGHEGFEVGGVLADCIKAL